MRKTKVVVSEYMREGILKDTKKIKHKSRFGILCVLYTYFFVLSGNALAMRPECVDALLPKANAVRSFSESSELIDFIKSQGSIVKEVFEQNGNSILTPDSKLPLSFLSYFLGTAPKRISAKKQMLQREKENLLRGEGSVYDLVSIQSGLAQYEALEKRVDKLRTRLELDPKQWVSTEEYYILMVHVGKVVDFISSEEIIEHALNLVQAEMKRGWVDFTPSHKNSLVYIREVVAGNSSRKLKIQEFRNWLREMVQTTHFRILDYWQLVSENTSGLDTSLQAYARALIPREMFVIPLPIWGLPNAWTQAEAFAQGFHIISHPKGFGTIDGAESSTAKNFQTHDLNSHMAQRALVIKSKIRNLEEYLQFLQQQQKILSLIKSTFNEELDEVSLYFLIQTLGISYHEFYTLDLSELLADSFSAERFFKEHFFYGEPQFQSLPRSAQLIYFENSLQLLRNLAKIYNW